MKGEVKQGVRIHDLPQNHFNVQVLWSDCMHQVSSRPIILPWPKKLRQPRNMTSIGRCSIVWYRPWYRDHEWSAPNAQPLNAIFALRPWSSSSNSVLSTSWFSSVSIFFGQGSRMLNGEGINYVYNCWTLSFFVVISCDWLCLEKNSKLIRWFTALVTLFLYTLQEESDLPFEEDIIKNPYHVKSWTRYIEHKATNKAPKQVTGKHANCGVSCFSDYGYGYILYSQSSVLTDFPDSEYVYVWNFSNSEKNAASQSVF